MHLKKSEKWQNPNVHAICFKGLKSESRLNSEIAEQEFPKWDPITMRFMKRNAAINHILNKLD
jgi:hypothetical protein